MKPVKSRHKTMKCAGVVELVPANGRCRKCVIEHPWQPPKPVYREPEPKPEKKKPVSLMPCVVCGIESDDILEAAKNW